MYYTPVKKRRKKKREKWSEPPTNRGLKGSTPPVSYLVALAWFAATDMERSRPAISVKAGRCAGSGAQHCSMSLLHSGSHEAGTGGLSVLFTMPPAKEVLRVTHVLTDQRKKKTRIMEKWINSQEGQNLHQKTQMTLKNKSEYQGNQS